MILPRQRAARASKGTARGGATAVKQQESSPTRIHVRYFAQLREQASRAEETTTTAARTAAALYEELRARHGFTVPARLLRVAINDDLATWDARLAAGDQVAFIPPFAGG